METNQIRWQMINKGCARGMVGSTVASALFAIWAIGSELITALVERAASSASARQSFDMEIAILILAMPLGWLVTSLFSVLPGCVAGIMIALTHEHLVARGVTSKLIPVIGGVIGGLWGLLVSQAVRALGANPRDFAFPVCIIAFFTGLVVSLVLIADYQQCVADHQNGVKRKE